MHPYIPYLLEDIAAAHRPEVPEESNRELTFEEQMAEVEAWATLQPEHTFSYYCGLKKEDFPPPAQLSDEDMQQVCKAFHKMMFSWNLDMCLPEKIPATFAYELTIDCLNKKTTIVNSGMIGFDFCTGYPPDCELKEYCPCRENWEG